MTNLEAVNYCLARVGLGRVSALETGTTSDAGSIEYLLDETRREVCEMGWCFNRRENVTATPNVSDQIIVSDIDPDSKTILKIGTYGPDSCTTVVVVNDNLYDRTDNTIEFDGPIKVWYTVLLDLADIPSPIAQYIAALTAVVYNDAHGMPQRSPVLRDNAQRALIKARQYDAQTQGLNVLDSNHARSVMGNRYDYEGGLGSV